MSPLDRNRVDIAIAIKEGKAAKIRHVNLVGTEKFESKDIPETWESKEHNWASWYRRDDQYSKEKLSGDLESSIPGTWTAAMSTSASIRPRCRSAPTSATCSSPPA